MDRIDKGNVPAWVDCPNRRLYFRCMAHHLLKTFILALFVTVIGGELIAANSWELCEGFDPNLEVEEQVQAFEEVIEKNSNLSLVEAEKSTQCFLDYALFLTDSVVIQRAYVLLGSIQFKNHKTEESLKNLNVALAIATKREDRSAMMKIHRLEGISYHFIGDRRKSKQSFFAALELSEELGDSTVTAQVLLNLGLINTMVNDYQEALVYYQKALDLSVIFNDPFKKCTVMQGLSVAYKGLNDLPKAQSYCKSALELAKGMDNPFLEATITYSSAEIWEGQNDSLALTYYERAIELYKQLDANSQVLRASLDYAEYLAELNKPYAGIALLEPVVMNNEITQGIDFNPDWYYVLGNLYFKTHDYEKAESIIKVGLSSGKKLSVSFLERSNFLLAQIYHEEKKFELASNYFQKAKSYADSVALETKEEQLVELQVKYNTENNKKALENLIELNRIREQQKEQNRYYFILLVVLFVAAVLVAVILGKQAKLRAVQSQKLKHQVTENEKKTADLIIASEKAKEGLRVKSEFISTISHEVRTPLTAILGMTDLVLDTKIDAIQTGYLNSIRTSGRNLLVLVNDILDFSKQEQNKLVLKKTSVSLLEDLNSIISVYEPLVNNKGLRFEVFLGHDLPEYVEVDSARVRQVIFNLLNNALKFTHSGFVKFTVMVLNSSKNQCDIRFKVSDSGVGIPAENQLEIFKPFNQVESSNTRRYEGTGIGLSISNAIIKQMDSVIQVSSNLGEGSSFWFDLTVKKTWKLAEGNKLQRVTKSKLDPKLAEKYPWKILIVEDNPINQRLLEVNLQQMGYQPILTENGEHALKVLLTTSVDLIFMDIQMPVMDGITATKEIVKTYGVNKPVIIALTANAIGSDKEKYMNAGMDDYISKPYTPIQIEQCLIKWHSNSISSELVL